ncbi:MAG: DUF1697 domain-containing protein [Bacteroidales bacterium]
MVYVAFIRNVMIGREGLLQKTLINIFEMGGCENVKSYLSTGNVSFNYFGDNIQLLATNIESEIQKIIGRNEDVFIRDLDYLKTIKANNYFLGNTTIENIHERCITFAANKIKYSFLLPLYSKRKDVELFKILGSEAYSVTRLIDGRTSSAGKIIEEELDIRVTTRNWNTINKIIDKLNNE